MSPIPAWQVKRRAERFQTLTTGDGFHEFAHLPASWSSRFRCLFCRRGEADGLTGLWDFGRVAWVCTDCARDIVEERMPVGRMG